MCFALLCLASFGFALLGLLWFALLRALLCLALFGFALLSLTGLGLTCPGSALCCFAFAGARDAQGLDGLAQSHDVSLHTSKCFQ